MCIFGLIIHLMFIFGLIMPHDIFVLYRFPNVHFHHQKSCFIRDINDMLLYTHILVFPKVAYTIELT